MPIQFPAGAMPNSNSREIPPTTRALTAVAVHQDYKYRPTKHATTVGFGLALFVLCLQNHRKFDEFGLQIDAPGTVIRVPRTRIDAPGTERRAPRTLNDAPGRKVAPRGRESARRERNSRPDLRASTHRGRKTTQLHPKNDLKCPKWGNGIAPAGN